MIPDAISYYHSSRRIRRSVVFALGLACGLAAGIGADRAYLALSSPKVESPAWSSSLVCRGHKGDVFFIENTSARDYRLSEGDFILMQQTKAGLIPTEAKLIVPLIVPRGETCGIRIEGAPASLVLFDLARRLRIELPAASR